MFFGADYILFFYCFKFLFCFINNRAINWSNTGNIMQCHCLETRYYSAICKSDNSKRYPIFCSEGNLIVTSAVSVMRKVPGLYESTWTTLIRKASTRTGDKRSVINSESRPCEGEKNQHYPSSQAVEDPL